MKRPQINGRFFAYLLFIIAVNLKIYPGIFLFCFTSDWRNWKANLRRWGLLLLANFACLFILGWRVFSDFIAALLSQLKQPSYGWVGNHSIDSFIRFVIDAICSSNPSLASALTPNIRWFSLALLAIYLLCLGGVYWIVYRRGMNAANQYVLLVLTIGALIIPSTSHDYKLCILAAPITDLFSFPPGT